MPGVRMVMVPFTNISLYGTASSVVYYIITCIMVRLVFSRCQGSGVTFKLSEETDPVFMIALFPVSYLFAQSQLQFKSGTSRIQMELLTLCRSYFAMDQ